MKFSLLVKTKLNLQTKIDLVYVGSKTEGNILTLSGEKVFV